MRALFDSPGIQTCPVCRSDFEDWQLDEGNISPKFKRINSLTTVFFSELHYSIANEHQDVYIQRQQVELDSGIYEPYEPLPFVDLDDSDTWSTVSSNGWLDDYASELWFLKLAMAILMALIQYGIIIMLYLLQNQTGDRRADAIIYEGLVPMIRVLTIAMAILGLISGVLWTIFTHSRAGYFR